MSTNTTTQKDYENANEKPKEMDDESKKLSKKFGSFLKYFSLTIIIFLIVSYISNNYIAGIGMNFIPLFLPIGKSFSNKPVLGTMFHPEKIPENSFFKTQLVDTKNGSTPVRYYELLEMGGGFLGILKGVTGLADLFNQSNVTETNLTPIYIADYTNSYWYQKLLLVIFGVIQILIGSVTTLFSSFAYLFSGKHGYLLNVVEEKKRMEKNKKYNFEDLGISMMKTKTDRPVLKSGLGKFALFFNFINFIFVDKLTYGTRYFLEDKHSSFMDRFKYFFFIVFVIFLLTQLRDSFSDSISAILWAVIIIIIVFILFATRILNPGCNPSAFANYEGLINEVKQSAIKSNSLNKEYDYDKLASDIKRLKETIDSSVKEYSNKAELLAKEIKLEKVPQVPIKEQIKEKMEEAKRDIKEGFSKIKEKFKKKPQETTETGVVPKGPTFDVLAEEPEGNKPGIAPEETSVESAAASAEKDLSPELLEVEAANVPTTEATSSQSGGQIKVKEKYRQRILELRKEIEELRDELDKNNL